MCPSLHSGGRRTSTSWSSGSSESRARSSSTAICSVFPSGRPASSQARMPPARYPATFSRPTRARRVRVSPTCSSSSATSTIGLPRRKERARPGGELARTGRCGASPGRARRRTRRTRAYRERRRPPSGAPQRRPARAAGGAGELLERPRALAVERRVARKVRRRLGQVRRHELDELLARHRPQRIVELPLLADRRARLARDVAPAERAGAVRGIDLHRVRQLQELLGGASRRACPRARPGSRARRGGPAARRRR